MKYRCGTEVLIGDEIEVAYGPNQEALARVMAIGLTLASDEIDKSFYCWAKGEGVLSARSVVIEWIRENPLAHDDPQYASVANYMTLSSLCEERFIRRAHRG
jgi:hypothetical protein